MDAKSVAHYRAQTPATMRLPEGKSCADCFHLNRCTMLFGVNSGNAWCDWNPSRFQQAKSPVTEVKP